MDNVLKILSDLRDKAKTEYEFAENQLAQWILFQKNSITVPLKEAKTVVNSNNGSWISRIKAIIKEHNSEMYSDEIVNKLLPQHPGHTVKTLSTRVSTVLSEDGDEHGVYGILDSDNKKNGKHHKAKKWGLNEFKDVGGKVKSEHKYKSTR